MKHLVSIAGSEPFEVGEALLLSLIHDTGAQVVTVNPDPKPTEWPSWSSLAQGEAETVG